MGNYFLIQRTFMDEPIDAVMLEDQTVGFTTYHLAKVLGLDEKSINQIIRRNYKLFDDSEFSVMMKQTSGNRRIRCLKQDGVVTLISLIDYKRYPEDKQESMIEFRKWSSKTISEILSGNVSDEFVTWLAERKLSKLLYKSLTDAVHQKLIPENASDKEKRMIYGHEANLLNLIVFGKKADGTNQRETASAEQLKYLNKAQITAPGLILGKIPYTRRLQILQEVVDQLIEEEKYPQLSS